MAVCSLSRGRESSGPSDICHTHLGGEEGEEGRESLEGEGEDARESERVPYCWSSSESIR